MRALLLTPVEYEYVREEPLPGPEVAQALAKSLTFRTISTGRRHDGEFIGFYKWLESTWVGFHQTVTTERFLEHSRLYTWRGSDPSLAPVLFLAHSDVVPVESGTEHDWEHPPFAGIIAPCVDEPGDCVWGRGAIDMKASLIGLVTAAEQLLSGGYVPQRTLLFAFGHDEEVGGRGAQAIARHLQKSGITPLWILDEGLLVTEGIVPGVESL